MTPAEHRAYRMGVLWAAAAIRDRLRSDPGATLADAADDLEDAVFDIAPETAADEQRAALALVAIGRVG